MIIPLAVRTIKPRWRNLDCDRRFMHAITGTAPAPSSCTVMKGSGNGPYPGPRAVIPCQRQQACRRQRT